MMANNLDSLSLFDSVILGIVQGLTEFFPVSSDGHLVLGQELLNYHKNNLVFDVLLHFGTLLALFVAFRKETKDLIKSTIKVLHEVLEKRSLKPAFSKHEHTRWIIYIWITTFVTGVFGLAFEEKVTELFESVTAAGVGFLITSAFLFIGSYRRFGKRHPGNMAWKFPFLIGLAQASALLPGVSRSGTTIALAMILGVERHHAGRFSFVAAIPIILLAVIYQARHLTKIDSSELGIMSVGVLVSFVVGLLAIKGLMFMLRKMTLYPFAVYTCILGIITILYFA
jgi:undecaprenyl-diphosphatase